VDHTKTFYQNLANVKPNDLYYIDIDNKGASKISNHPLATYLDDIVQADDSSLPQPFDDPNDTTGLEFLQLYKNIKTNGYNANYPIQVAIDPIGRPIICEGIHRTLICRKLEIDLIPCFVVYRSIEWWLFKHALYNQHSKTTNLYQKINHFDLNSWSAWRVDCSIRADLIYKDLLTFHKDPTNLVGVELACNTGNISCALARNGITMHGFDVDSNCIESASQLAPMDSIGARFISNNETMIRASFGLCGYIVDPKTIPNCDFVICLSLLNHHQTDGRSEEGLTIFRNLATKTNRIYLDCPVDSDAVGGGTEFTQYQKVFDWCASAGIGGRGRVVALIESNKPLMRPLLVWEF
jgi:hypothetical protein